MTVHRSGPASWLAGLPPLSRERVVLDVDTGVDDALALLVALRSPRVEVVAVTCVAGNVPLARVVANTRFVLAAAGRCDVQIGVGLDRPVTAGSRHGPDGLAGLAPARPAAAPTPLTDARTLLAAAGAVTVLGLGPATTLATVDLRRVARVVTVATDAGEANAAMDPEAASALARAGVPLLRLGGTAFTTPRLTPARVAEVPGLVGGLLRHQAARGAGLGDAGAVLLLDDPGGAIVRGERVSAVDGPRWTDRALELLAG